MKDRARFECLRARWLLTDTMTRNLEVSIAAHYGRTEWAPLSAQRRLGKLRENRSKLSDRFFALLDRISPRDWHSGVPMSWVCGCLSFDDAVRPKGEALSTVPPCAYGATSPLR